MTTNRDVPVVYREIRKEDEQFIYSSWLRSYRNLSENQRICNDLYFFHHAKVIKKVLEDPNVTVVIVCDQEDSSNIIGYAITEARGAANIIHYCYVKHTFRKFSICKTLLTHHIADFGKKTILATHTHRNNNLMKKFNIVYNPYLQEQSED